MTEFDNVETTHLSNIIYHFIDFIREFHDFEEMRILAENGSFFTFTYRDTSLGVLSEAEINFPLLQFFVKKALPCAILKNEKNASISMEEEIPFFFQLSCSDYYRKFSRLHEKEKAIGEEKLPTNNNKID
ncbi:MAG: hypothetical protein HXS53_03135 [Theionarchaea archaeon]|nr:hypothetical protein [Theionarchaea archaeon]